MHVPLKWTKSSTLLMGQENIMSDVHCDKSSSPPCPVLRPSELKLFIRTVSHSPWPTEHWNNTPELLYNATILLKIFLVISFLAVSSRVETPVLGDASFVYRKGPDLWIQFSFCCGREPFLPFSTSQYWFMSRFSINNTIKICVQRWHILQIHFRERLTEMSPPVVSIATYRTE